MVYPGNIPPYLSICIAQIEGNHSKTHVIYESSKTEPIINSKMDLLLH